MCIFSAFVYSIKKIIIPLHYNNRYNLSCMKYTVNLTGNKASKDGSILGKVCDFKYEMEQHEKEELNNYKKHPHMSACDRTSIVHNRHTNRDVETIMFG